jgi:hypothetical protein
MKLTRLGAYPQRKKLIHAFRYVTQQMFKSVANNQSFITTVSKIGIKKSFYKRNRPKITKYRLNLALI